MLRTNKDQPLVSIIVPVYNAERYLEECLDSILKQSYINFELIIVDDNSTDNSKYIAEQYRKLDTRVKLVIKKINQGINPARATGFSHIKGDYVMFVDNDDIITESLIEDHLAALVDTDADVSISKAVWWNNDEAIDFESYTNDCSGDIKVLNRKLSYRCLITETSPFSDSEVGILWNKLHRRSFFEGYDWNLSNMPSEDFMTNAYLFNNIKSAVFIDKTHYFHRTNVNSTMDRLSKKEGANVRQALDIFDALFKVAEVFGGVSRENNWKFENEILYFKYRYFYIRMNAFIENGKLSKSDFNKIKKYTESSEIELLTSDYFERYVSEYIYTPAPEILRSIRNFWIDFNKSKSIESFLQRRLGQLCTTLHLAGRREDFLSSELSMKSQTLNDIETLKGSVFNFLGKFKHKIVKKALTNPLKFATLYSELKMNKKYKNCWLVMDRVDSASDNGYAFYSHLLEYYPEKNAYFVISSASNDIPRLQSEGFKLIFTDTHEHEIALRNSSSLFYAYFTFEYDNPQARRVFLGHGITKDRIPNPGLAAKDYFITAIEKEQEFLSERVDFSPLKTGLPRHDRLIKRMNENRSAVSRDTIVIAPTWRPWLTSTGDDFKDTEYFINWQRLLQSNELKNLAGSYEIVLLMHPMITKVVSNSFFDVPELIQLREYGEIGLDGLHDILIRTELIVTDYSSVSFDAVIAGSKVVYFQFDKREYRTRGHLQEGWFEYVKNGYGPVCLEYSSLLQQLQFQLHEANGSYENRRIGLQKEIFKQDNASESIVRIMSP